MKTRVILTCGDEEKRQAYIKKIGRPDIGIDAVSSLSELYLHLLEKSYNGILIDVKTKMRASGREKELIHSLLDSFPVVQLTLDKSTGEIRSLSSGKPGGEETIENFLTKDCGSFKARSIRADSRKEVNMNVLLSEGDVYSETDAGRSVTINISRGGCFIYSTTERQLQGRVSFIFKELSDHRPMCGEVRWQVPWGHTMRIPGIGVKFIDIPQDQHKRLCIDFNL